MLKIFGDSICVLVELFYKQALLTGGNIVPIHKKSDKQNIENYRPISLIPTCGKIFERLIFNEFLSIYPLIKSSLNTSLASNLVIPVSTNCYQLPTKFLHLLIMD